MQFKLSMFCDRWEDIVKEKVFYVPGEFYPQHIPASAH
jgi:hypothetical protein